jgi:hypothetical protein
MEKHNDTIHKHCLDASIFCENPGSMKAGIRVVLNTVFFTFIWAHDVDLSHIHTHTHTHTHTLIKSNVVSYTSICQ